MFIRHFRLTTLLVAQFVLSTWALADLGFSGRLVTGHYYDRATAPANSRVSAFGTFYAYKEDKVDRNTARGYGPVGKLVPGESVGMSPSLMKAIHAKYGDHVAARYSNDIVLHGVLWDPGN